MAYTKRVVRKYAKRASRAAASPLAKVAMGAARNSKYGSAISKMEKTANFLKDQQLFEGSSMSALRMATAAINLIRRESPGRNLPVFSGSNRKVVIPTVSTGTVSTSVYGFKYNSRPIPRKTGDVNSEVRKNSRFSVTSTENTQSVFDFPLLSCAPLAGESTDQHYTSVTYEAAFDTLFNVAGELPAITIPASSIDQNRMALDRFESTMKIQNEGAGPVEVTIYDLMPKRDVPRATYVNRLTASGLQSPSNTWTTGLTNAVYVEDAMTPNVVGTIPTTNLKFNTFWKVMKRTKIELSSGSSHIHRGCNILNTLFNHYDYSEVLGLRAMLCPTIMLVFSGLPSPSQLAEPASLAVSTENVLYARSAVNDNITVRNFDATLT